MKRLFSLFAATLILAGLGCASTQEGACPPTRCYPGGHTCGPQCEHTRRAPRGPTDIGAQVAGPPTAQVTYPYYTLRGPRDFLDRDPPSIGP